MDYGSASCKKEQTPRSSASEPAVGQRTVGSGKGPLGRARPEWLGQSVSRRRLQGLSGAPLPELSGSRLRGPSFLHMGPRLQSPTCTPKDLLASGPPALAAHTEMKRQVSSAHPDRGRPQGFAARLGGGRKG